MIFVVCRDVYPGTVADPRIKPVRMLVTRKRRNPDFTTKSMLVRFSHLLHTLIHSLIHIRLLDRLTKCNCR